MTARTFQEIEAESAAEIVVCVGGRGVTRRELTAAFNRVAPRDNWKLPIDVTIDTTPEERLMIAEAITFFTGSVAKFEPRGELAPLSPFRITAPGYYATCGA